MIFLSFFLLLIFFRPGCAHLKIPGQDKGRKGLQKCQKLDKYLEDCIAYGKSIMDMFTGACGIILTLNLPKNQQKSFFGNNSLIFMHFLLKIGDQILFTMIDITDSF